MSRGTFVKRQLHDLRRIHLTFEIDLNLRARSMIRIDVRHRDRLLHRRAERAAGDFADVGIAVTCGIEFRSLACLAIRRLPAPARRAFALGPFSFMMRSASTPMKSFVRSTAQPRPGGDRIDRLRSARGRTAACPLRVAACRARRAPRA